MSGTDCPAGVHPLRDRGVPAPLRIAGHDVARTELHLQMCQPATDLRQRGRRWRLENLAHEVDRVGAFMAHEIGGGHDADHALLVDDRKRSNGCAARKSQISTSSVSMISARDPGHDIPAQAASRLATGLRCPGVASRLARLPLRPGESYTGLGLLTRVGR